MKPQARVVAYTIFNGIPTEVLGQDDLEACWGKGQDEGSGMARLIELAGRECYTSYGKGRPSEDYHQHLKEVGHGSVLEHASLSFRIWGISRSVSHELVRHRAGTAISQRSTRYVDESESEWAWHPLAIGLSPMAPPDPLNIDGHTDQARYLYRQFVESIQMRLEQRGVDKVTARKQARGAARGVLGNALETSLIWTANIRALRNVLEQRASPHADAEIRLLANALYEAAYPYCPEYLCDYEKEPCPDGIGYALATPYRKI